MLQHSKVVRGRDAWKRKAVKRAGELRKQRKVLKRTRQRVTYLEARLKAVEQVGKQPSPTAPVAVNPPGAGAVRALCVALVLQAVVSFRSVPRILR